MNTDERLVVLSEDADAMERLASRYAISQVASPRVVVVRRPPSESDAALESRPEVMAVGEDAADLAAGLTEAEALFVAASAQRTREAGTKQRAGDGLSWDHAGFEPPDPPPGMKGPE